MTILTLPAQTATDIELAKDFLFEVYGEHEWTERAYLELSDRTNHIVELDDGKLIIPHLPTLDTVLTLPLKHSEDSACAKDFLFEVYGESGWTESAYLELADRTHRIIELKAERLIVSSMPTLDHQNIIGNLYELFRAWARKFGGLTIMAAYPIRLAQGKFREPDLMIYAAEDRERAKKQYGEPPNLVVEVLSPNTRKIDLEEKIIEYAEAGIGEYWIVDTEEVQIEQYVLEGDRYKLHATLSKGDVLRAATLEGLEVRVDGVYEK
jgi:Uma2 family endonuclease